MFIYYKGEYIPIDAIKIIRLENANLIIEFKIDSGLSTLRIPKMDPEYQSVSAALESITINSRSMMDPDQRYIQELAAQKGKVHGRF